jgi:hypothetical protein
MNKKLNHNKRKNIKEKKRETGALQVCNAL